MKFYIVASVLLGSMLAGHAHAVTFPHATLQQDNCGDSLFVSDAFEEFMMFTFNFADEDGNGFLSAAELRDTNPGEGPTEEEAEGMIKLADFDGDGQVSYDEFAKFAIQLVFDAATGGLSLLLNGL